jgi:FtsP/CotA-like multicopper oxidase with cupredoxin domain
MIKKTIYFASILMFLAFVPFAYCEEAHEHKGHAPAVSEKKHDMNDHSKEHSDMHEKHQEKKSETDMKNDYIRTMTPAGYNAVIGKKNPLEELKPDITKDNDGNTIKVFNLTVEDVKFEIFPGKFIDGWGFNGIIPGPTIRVKEGDRIRIIFTNKTETEHTIHVHGQKKSVEMDGVPYIGQKPVKKGESYTYEFKVINPGTHWYHCHVDSAHHVDMGMYGAFIVEPQKEELKYDREYTMMVDEWPTAHIHIHKEEMPMDEHKEHGIVTEHPGEMKHDIHAEKPAKRDWYPETHTPYKPVYDGFSINGKSFPFTEPVVVKKGERVRIRFINTGYKSHFMHTHSHKFMVVARSGSPVNEPQRIDTVEIGAGQRVDIILFADNPGVWPFHCHILEHIANDHVYPGGMMMFIQYEE